MCLPADDPIEDFSEEDMATGSMAAAGRSPNKHPRTGSEEDSVDIAALLDRAADRFSACMDTKVDSMMDRLEKRIDEKIDSKLGPVMDWLSVLEKTSSSTRRGPSSLSDNGGSTGQSSATGVAPAVFAPSYLEIKGWCGFRDRNTHGLTEAQAREIITKLRQGIGPDLDSLIARVGAMRVRNTKIICYLKTPNLSSCKQIREAMNAFIEKENIKLGPQGTNPFVVLTAIPKKSDKVGFRSMRYISLLPVMRKFYIRALQSAVRRERTPHETNIILGYEPGRSTAGVTATLRQVLNKAAEWGVGVFVAWADVEGAFDGIKHCDVEKALLQEGVHPESVYSLLRESSDLKGRINLLGAPMSLAFLYARGARQGSVEGPDIWNQVLDKALREPAGRWETEVWVSCLPETTAKPKRSLVVHLVML